MITDKQQRCIAYLMAGKQYKEIANCLGITTRTIMNWKKADDFKIAYAEALHEEFSDLATEAKQTLVELMRHSSSDTVRLNASKDILSRAGYDAVAKQQITTPDNIVITIDGEEPEVIIE